jgi:hypothetical protein
MNVKRSWSAALAFALLGASLATATTVQKLSLQDLARKSDAIVVDEVEQAVSRWDDEGKEIYTYVTVRVSDHVKGQKGQKGEKGQKGPDTLTLRQLGGQVDKIASVVPGMPEFRKGEEVVLFLSQKDAAGYPWVVGLQQGKYSVVTDENGLKQVRNDVDGLNLAGPGGLEAKGSSQMPLDAFLESVRNELNLPGKTQIDPTATEQ